MTRTIGLLSTYPPTQCGLATFTAALHAALSDAGVEAGVVRVLDDVPSINPILTSSRPEIAGHLINGVRRSELDAIDLLNTYGCVFVQHEYGIFGGPDGEDILGILEALTVPTIVVLHTVLVTPTPNQRRVLERVIERADALVTMTRTARRRVIDGYGADPASITVIPHGAADHRRAGAIARPNSRPTILTWGLLGPGKGIEWAIEAMASLRDLDPLPRYLIVGKTHPRVLAREGDSYRQSLIRRARDLGVEDMIEFDTSYLDLPTLGRLIEGADVVLLPYDSREQVTSGVLIEAVTAGRPVVSTSFPHALELLGTGAGLTVPQQDASALSSALRRVLTEPGLASRMSKVAASLAPDLVWPAVGRRYRDLAADVSGAALIAMA